MPIKFKCPHCQTALEAVDESAGKKGSCPMCGQVVSVPKTNSSSETESKESAKKD
jgi:transcription initiation factor IIE alpha subunit